eukprot:3436454-Rhodomonas_salina.3
MRGGPNSIAVANSFLNPPLSWRLTVTDVRGDGVVLYVRPHQRPGLLMRPAVSFAFTDLAEVAACLQPRQQVQAQLESPVMLLSAA